MMELSNVDPSLLYLEVPVSGPSLQNTPSRELLINEGKNAEAELCNFDEAGGGMDVVLPSDVTKRTIFWRTNGSRLEFFENSLQLDLEQNHLQIVFQNSKVLPNVKIFHLNKQVIILCATLHAAHRIVINVSRLKQNQAILSGITDALLSNPKHNFYFTQLEQVVAFSSNLFKKRQSHNAIFAFGVATGNVIVLKMPLKGPAILSRLNQASRISRLLSGINPWSGSSEGDVPCDLTFIPTADPTVVSICRDAKLKIWSAQSNDCLNQVNLNEILNEELRNRLGKLHKIRSSASDEDDLFVIEVYLSFDDVSLFLGFLYDQSDNSMEHLSTIEFEMEVDLTPNTKLIDYQITSSYHLWVLWRDAEDEMTLSVCHVTRKQWHDVTIASPPPHEVAVSQNFAIQESYMDVLFTPGYFSPVAIAKAISMHQRSVYNSRNLSWNSLRENVLKLVNNEVLNELPDDGSASLTTTLEAQSSVWQRFYQTCLQYQKSVCSPLGLAQQSSECADAVSLVKKDVISYLVPLSSLEAMCRGAKPSMLTIAVSNEQNVDELGKLISCLSLLASILGLDYVDNLVQSLSLFSSPIDLIKDEMDTIKAMMNDRIFYPELQKRLLEVRDVALAVNMLLTCLDPRASEFGFVSTTSANLTGNSGIEVLCRVVQRYVNDRLQLSLLLLILTMFIDELQNTGPPRVSMYVQSYSAIKWAVTSSVERAPQSSLESTLQSLSVTDGYHPNAVTLLEYFLRGRGGVMLQQILDLDGSLSLEAMPRAVDAVVQLLWPTGPTMSFPEFLLSKAQFSRLRHYLESELWPWCDFCPSYTLYLLGSCLMHTGLYNKAVETLLLAANKLSNEEIHLLRMLDLEGEDDVKKIESAFYTKILQTFEQLDLSEQVIQIAKHAIEKISPDDPNLPLLCSSIFYQSLHLQRYDDAYEAIVWNPDPEHKKDCLRTMVVALCDRKEYKTLVEYPYDDLQTDLIHILEHRARCSDLMTSPHHYYDLLFAFHIYRENYRRAASTMYEQAWRISMEQSDAAAVRRRHTCLVSAVSCLLLVDPENHWIVHPSSSQETYDKDVGARSPKRNYDGEEVEPASRRVVVCELEDLRREILLVEARLKIADETKDEGTVSAGTTAEETVALLNHAGLYQDAFNLSSKFDISPVSTFQSLATRCVQSSYLCDDLTATSWIAKHDHVPHVDGRSSASDVAWRLLKNFLKKHGGSPGCYRAVLTTLLGYNCILPAWLVSEYKQLNAAELIRMLVCYDYLEQATSICVEYIDAILGVGSQEFNVKSTLSSIGPSVWLPYTEMEQLLYVLRENRAQKKCLELNDTLSSKIDNYFMEAKKVAAAKVFS